jgi:hypothetical protein
MRLSPRNVAPAPPAFLAVDPDEERRRLAQDALVSAPASDSASAATFVDPSEQPASSGFLLKPRKIAQAPVAQPQPPPATTAGKAPAPAPTNPAIPVVDQPTPEIVPANVPEPEHIVGDTGPAPFESAYHDFYDDPDTRNLDALKVAERASQPVKNHNSRLKSALKTMLIAGGEMARQHPATTWQELMPTLGAAATGLATGAAKPDTDEFLQRQADNAYLDQEKDRGLKIQERGARIRQVNAAAAYTEQRPALEGRKLAVQQLIAQEKARLSDKRLTEGERHNLAVENLRKMGLINIDEYRDSLIEEKKADREQRGAQFEEGMRFKRETLAATERDRKIKNELSARRTAAYETAVKQSGSKQAGNQAAAAAEAQMYGEMANEVDSDIDKMESTTPDEEKDSEYERKLGQLTRESRQYRAKAGASGIKGGAGRYSGQTFSDAQLPQIRKKFPKGTSDEQIKQTVTSNGGTWQ